MNRKKARTVVEFYKKRDEFARALALSCAEPASKEGIWQPWAYFRLGMYETVASLEIDPCDPAYAEYQLLPAIVSQAALGEHSSVRHLIAKAPWGCLPISLRIAVAKYLSSYMPQDALRLLKGVDEALVPAAVRILILLRAGHKNAASSVVKMEMLSDKEKEKSNSIIHLYRTITEKLSPQQGLECLNYTFSECGLPILALLRDDEPLNPCNVYSPGPHASVEGPLVSVLMTTFNVERRVSAAIESILSQSYCNLELIVVDDCSTDNSVFEIEKWKRADSRVRFFRLDRNVGTYCAKSIGLGHAKGYFVTCMDADDWAHPLKLEWQIKPLLQDDYLIATTSNCIRVFDTGEVDTQPSVNLIHLNPSSLLFRREKIISDIGGWDACARTAADTEMIGRIALVYGSHSTKNVPALLSLVSRRADSLTMASDNTGFTGNKYPVDVLRYHEEFNKWHINLFKSGYFPKVSENPADWVCRHPFRFASTLFVDANDILNVVCEAVNNDGEGGSEYSYHNTIPAIRLAGLDKVTDDNMDQFARALALADTQPCTQQGIWQPWAYFRLGMYETIASLGLAPTEPEYAERQLLPVSVSLAALGRYAEAKALLDRAPWSDLEVSLRVAIAKHLSSYMPLDALKLLEGLEETVPEGVYTLLLLRAGHIKRAQSYIRGRLSLTCVDRSPDFHLYQTITEDLLPSQQLSQINRVFTSYDLPVLKLIHDSRSLSPFNVETEISGSPTDGPMISILMTTFNVEARVSAAIESILKQSYKNLELIIVDDYSADSTAEEIKKWIAKDLRVRFFRLKHNVGTYCAKSIGLKYARGEFVTCMDADDWAHPLKLERQIKPLLIDESLVATTSNWIRISDAGVVDIIERVDLVNLNYSSLLIRRGVLADMGGWDACARTGADVEIVRRIDLIYGRQATLNLPEPLSLASRRGDSLTMAKDGTGFCGDVFPPELLKYIESFNQWHIDSFKNGAVPRVLDDMREWAKFHPFIFPSSIFVELDSMKMAFNTVESVID